MQTTKHPDEKELEERHVAGYEREPAEPDEFDIPDGDHAWGDGRGVLTGAIWRGTQPNLDELPSGRSPFPPA